uniref:Uncharacterized protein n=1 Tax=Spongospora subterranea TaxID=70186 RepID=A0A0H5RA82_9EUKA|eukprot:CRZ05324.1 hypothetical protein [Spongospora subterranea]
MALPPDIWNNSDPGADDSLWPHLRIRQTRALDPYYHNWPKELPTPLSMFPLSVPDKASFLPGPEPQPTNSIDVVDHSMNPSFQQESAIDWTNGTTLELMKQKWRKSSSKRVSVKLPSEIAQRWVNHVALHNSWNISLYANIVLHEFLSNELFWQKWAMISNSIVTDIAWQDPLNMEFRLSVIDHREMIRFRNSYGVYHSYRVLLPAVLWALETGFGLPQQNH